MWPHLRCDHHFAFVWTSLHPTSWFAPLAGWWTPKLTCASSIGFDSTIHRRIVRFIRKCSIHADRPRLPWIRSPRRHSQGTSPEVSASAALPDVTRSLTLSSLHRCLQRYPLPPSAAATCSQRRCLRGSPASPRTWATTPFTKRLLTSRAPSVVSPFPERYDRLGCPTRPSPEVRPRTFPGQVPSEIPAPASPIFRYRSRQRPR